MPESESAGEISRLLLIRAGMQLNQSGEKTQGNQQLLGRSELVYGVATQATSLVENVTNDVVFLIIYKYTQQTR